MCRFFRAGEWAASVPSASALSTGAFSGLASRSVRKVQNRSLQGCQPVLNHQEEEEQ
jgi:hypothetical protein